MEPEIKEHKTYHTNSKLCVHSFQHNYELEGEFKCWYGNGQPYRQCFYRNGKLEGEYKRWYRNGRLCQQCFYCNGKREGGYKSWFSSGQISEHYYYYNDKIVCELNDNIIQSMVKFQRSYRISRVLTKYFASREFVEWWYSPNVKGGMLAKQDISNTLSRIID